MSMRSVSDGAFVADELDYAPHKRSSPSCRGKTKDTRKHRAREENGT